MLHVALPAHCITLDLPLLLCSLGRLRLDLSGLEKGKQI